MAIRTRKRILSESKHLVQAELDIYISFRRQMKLPYHHETFKTSPKFDRGYHNEYDACANFVCLGEIWLGLQPSSGIYSWNHWNTSSGDPVTSSYYWVMIEQVCKTVVAEHKVSKLANPFAGFRTHPWPMITRITNSSGSIPKANETSSRTPFGRPLVNLDC